MSYGTVTIQSVTKPALRIVQADKLALFSLELLSDHETKSVRIARDELDWLDALGMHVEPGT